MRVRFSLKKPGEAQVFATRDRKLEVEGEASERAQATFSQPSGESDLCEVTATLEVVLSTDFIEVDVWDKERHDRDR